MGWGRLLATRRKARICSPVVGLMEELLEGGWEEQASVDQEGGSNWDLVVMLFV